MIWRFDDVIINNLFRHCLVFVSYYCLQLNAFDTGSDKMVLLILAACF